MNASPFLPLSLIVTGCACAFSLLPLSSLAQSATGGTVRGGTVTGGSATGGTVTGGTVTGGNVTGGSVTGGSVTGGNVTGGSVTGGNVTGGSVSGGSATATGGSATAGSTTAGSVTLGKATATATVGNRQIIATGTGSISVQPQGESAVVSIDGRSVLVERERLSVNGKEAAKLPVGAAKIEVDSSGGKLSIKADGKEVPLKDGAASGR